MNDDSAPGRAGDRLNYWDGADPRRAATHATGTATCNAVLKGQGVFNGGTASGLREARGVENGTGRDVASGKHGVCEDGRLDRDKLGGRGQDGVRSLVLRNGDCNGHRCRRRGRLAARRAVARRTRLDRSVAVLGRRVVVDDVKVIAATGTCRVPRRAEHHERHQADREKPAVEGSNSHNVSVLLQPIKDRGQCNANQKLATISVTLAEGLSAPPVLPSTRDTRRSTIP